MSFDFVRKWWKSTRRKYRNPSYLSLLIFPSAIVLLVWFEIRLGVDKEVIAISITGVIGFLGYFITHYLERERKIKDEKYSLYTDLMSSIRVFTTTSKDKTKAAETFAKVYYTSYLYMSTVVYEKLKDYMNHYKTWVSDKSDTNKKALDEKLTKLMQAMRDEITLDRQTDFASFDIKATPADETQIFEQL